jgi:hypothetical protein
MAGLIRTPRSGAVLKRIGVALVAAAFTAPFAIQFMFDDIGMQVPPGAIVFMIFLMLIPGAFLYHRGRQYAAQARTESIVTTSKAHVLYLRAFETDRSFKVWQSQWAYWAFLGTEEEKLADVLRPFGDLIAIGRPNERLPTLGAARIYTSDEEWKDVVERQMQAAQLVVIRAGGGENVFWELTQAIKILDPQRLLILVLNMWDDYELFRTRVSSLLPVPLPAPTLLRSSWPPSGFIGFAEDWTPRFLALGGLQYSLKGRFKCALKPVFQSFGLEWQAPWVSAGRVAGALLVLAIVPLALFGLWRGPPYNTDVFQDRGAQEAYVRNVANECKTANVDPSRKDRLARWCDCFAREVVKVVNVQEFEAAEKGQYPDSLREKVKRFKC